jgi:predicted NBD/HSP70 family sugar kinase
VRTIEELLRLAEDLDQDAIDALNKQAEYIGKGLRSVSAALAPEVILIAGEIVASWARFGPVIQKAFTESALAGIMPRLMPTYETEVAELRGAAILALQRRSSQLEFSGAKNAHAVQRKAMSVS